MKSHGKSKAVLSAIIFEVNLLQSSRFGEAILTHSNRFGVYIACVKMQFIDIENYKFLLEILLLINVSRR